MSNKNYISDVSKELKDIQYLMSSLKDKENISNIEIDIILSKVRNIYDDLLKLKHFNEKSLAEIISDNKTTVDNFEKVEETIKIEPTKVIEETKDIIEEVVEEDEKPIIESDVKLEEIINEIKEGIVDVEEMVSEVEEEIAEVEEVVSEVEEEIAEEEEIVSEIEEEIAVEEEIVSEIEEEIAEEEEIVSEVEEEIAEEEEIVSEVEEEIVEEEQENIKEDEIIEEDITNEESEVDEVISKAEDKEEEVEEIIAKEVEKPIDIKPEIKVELQKKPEIKQTSLFGDDTNTVKNTPSNIPTQQEKKESISDKLKTNTISVNDALSDKVNKSNLASQMQQKPVTNIKSAISINDRIWFVKELFKNNNDKYSMVIDKINGFSNYNEAIDYLSTEFNLSEEKESLSKFLSIVQRRFL